ncbi:MAG: proton-conducting membrane transporter [Planctomycetota bacterium]|nr:MAG: proton-conducting membrane transporter [Planctomycetota bacterium]
MERLGASPDKVLEILQAIQDHYGYLPQEVLEHICEATEITPASITGISTFYDQFRHRPAGKYIVRVCVGTACHVKGAQQVYDAFHRYLRIEPGADTDPDELFTIERVACLGCCTLAPAVQIGDITYGHLTAHSVGEVLDDFLRHRQTVSAKKAHAPAATDGRQAEIRIGLGSCCIARGSGKLNDALNDALEETGINALVKRVGCVGMCHQTPLLEIVLPSNESFLYARVQPEDARSIVLRHLRPGGLKQRISTRVSTLLDDLLAGGDLPAVTRYSIDVRDKPVADFLGKQKNIATEYCGVIDPVDLDEYISKDGFKALAKCVNVLDAEAIINEIRQSGLRGRGGAGYPTHLKWAAVHDSDSGTKYVVCNGDEGDPGAFMDRMLMESYPYRIIEGLAVAARVVGATQGYFYIRAEYPLAIKRMTEAIDKCRRRGFIGENILGGDFSLELKIVPGAGAFVCGEETALLASIMGKRGMPRLRPPYPAHKGLWGKPTLINNVETYALVPWIIRSGGETFARLGAEASKGTKVFALAGKVARGGLIEVPMGISIREVVEEIGGGIGGELRFKAVQVGGPSGGCVPAKLGHISVDYESLTQAGAIMGSGGLVVLDESDCMVDIARYFLEFTQNQSCGRCTFCRVGTRRMLDILERICNGQGKKGDIEDLRQLALKIKESSLCGLGKTAPNPVLSTIEYFRDEYESHIDKRCPAGRCKALITYTVGDDCIGCTLCAQHCPVDAIEMRPWEKHEIDSEKCVRCDTCRRTCPEDAIKVE